jgi:hypothetical protein
MRDMKLNSLVPADDIGRIWLTAATTRAKRAAGWRYCRDVLGNIASSQHHKIGRKSFLSIHKQLKLEFENNSLF